MLQCNTCPKEGWVAGWQKTHLPEEMCGEQDDIGVFRERESRREITHSLVAEPWLTHHLHHVKGRPAQIVAECLKLQIQTKIQKQDERR